MAWALFAQFILPIIAITLVPAIGLLLWLLPETNRAPERLLIRGLFAYMIVLICWPDYIALDLPGLPWLTLIRLVGIPLALLFLIALSISREYRARGAAILGGAPIIWQLVVAFAVISALSVALSANPFFSLQKVIIAQINWTAIFFMSCYVFTVPNMLTRTAVLLWACAVFVCLLAIWEGHLGRVPWYGHIPSFLAIQDEAVLKVLSGSMRAGTTKFRAQSKFGSSLGLGEYLALSTPFILHFAASAQRVVVRLAAVATLPVVGYAIFLTDSRLAAIGFLTSLAMYVLFLGILRIRRGKDDMVGSTIVFGYPAVLAVLLAATIFIGRIRARVWGDGSQQASNDARHAMYESGIPMILKHPQGFGFGMGGDTLGFRTPGGMLTIDTYYLTVGLEVGILGFLVYFGMMAAAIYRASRTLVAHPEGEFEWLGPIAIALVNFIVIKSVFSGTENHPIVFMMLGIVAALAYRARQAEPARIPPLKGAASLQPARTRLRPKPRPRGALD